MDLERLVGDSDRHLGGEELGPGRLLGDLLILLRHPGYLIDISRAMSASLKLMPGNFRSADRAACETSPTRGHGRRPPGRGRGTPRPGPRGSCSTPPRLHEVAKALPHPRPAARCRARERRRTIRPHARGTAALPSLILEVIRRSNEGSNPRGARPRALRERDAACGPGVSVRMRLTLGEVAVGAVGPRAHPALALVGPSVNLGARC
jgi:hypothetical protein